MADATRERILFGTDEPAPPRRTLHAGPLAVDLVAGNLRNIRFGGREAMRAVSLVVRDENWGTHAIALRDLTVQETPGGFSVSYRGRCLGAGGQALDCDASIVATANSLRFSATLLPHTRFRTVRAGFVVLHPLAGVVGQPVEVLHSDGRQERALFPERIASTQVWKDVQALRHSIAPGVEVTCRMDGDVFEVEDQRNWGDASFKTYSRPLELPYPYDLEAGVAVIQSVTLTFTGTGTDGVAEVESPATRSEPVVVTLGPEIGVMPAVGIGIQPRDLDASERVTDALRDLEAGFLLGHLDLSRGHGGRELARYGDLARAVGTAPALELGLGGDRAPIEELAALAELARRAEIDPIAVTVGPGASFGSASALPGARSLEDIYQATRDAFPNARIGGGTFAFFAELNRKPPPTGALDYITHTTCSIIHAADDVSVMETLETLPFIFASALALAGRAAYRVGPIGIGMRLNPYGVAPAENPGRRRIATAAEDPRQSAGFAAAFYLGYGAQAARAGIEALTLCAPTGPFGLIADRDRVVPAYHVVKALAAAAGEPRLGVETSDPRRVDAVAFHSDGAVVTLLANLTPHPVEIRLTRTHVDVREHRAWVIDERNVDETCSRRDMLHRDGGAIVNGTLSLGAFAVALVRS